MHVAYCANRIIDILMSNHIPMNGQDLARSICGNYSSLKDMKEMEQWVIRENDFSEALIMLWRNGVVNEIHYKNSDIHIDMLAALNFKSEIRNKDEKAR